MADQIYDKKTVGIPEDVVVVKGQVEEMRDTAEAYKNAAAASANQSQAYAAEARDWATESEKWALVRNLGVSMQTAPPDFKVDGMVWFKTDEEKRQIVSINRYDATSREKTVFPSKRTFPSKNLYPRTIGEWTAFRLAPTTIA